MGVNSSSGLCYPICVAPLSHACHTSWPLFHLASFTGLFGDVTSPLLTPGVLSDRKHLRYRHFKSITAKYTHVRNIQIKIFSWINPGLLSTQLHLLQWDLYHIFICSMFALYTDPSTISHSVISCLATYFNKPSNEMCHHWGIQNSE